jgi:hypothetical protein
VERVSDRHGPAITDRAVNEGSTTPGMDHHSIV